MTDKIKVINKKDVKLGMFVLSYGNGSFHDPQVRVGEFMDSYENIAKYLPDDTEHVEICTNRFLDSFENKILKSNRTADEAAKDLAEALPAAYRVYDEAMSYVKKMLSDIRSGEKVKLDAAELIVDKVIEDISTNRSASLTLSFLKNYDEYTYTHCINVNLFAVLLGKDAGLDKTELQQLGVAALFHDVGKGRIPNKVLNKPGKLTDDEYNLMKTHSVLGLKVLSSVQGMRKDILRGVVEHHERFNGTGYPRCLAGEDIHPFARIIAIADVFDALTSSRIYKKAMTASESLSLMYTWNSKDFDPEYFNRFVTVIGVYPPGTFVQLDDGRFALVLETNENAPHKPMVKVLFDKKKHPVYSECIDLGLSEIEGENLSVMRQTDPAELGINKKFFKGFLA